MKKQTGKISLPETRAPGTLPEPVRTMHGWNDLYRILRKTICIKLLSI